MRLSAIYAVPFSFLVSLLTSSTTVIATIGRCNALSPFATVETRKLDSPKRSVELTTRGIRIPLPSSFFVLFASKLLNRSRPSNFHPTRRSRIASERLSIPSSLSHLQTREQSHFCTLALVRESRFLWLYTPDPPARYYDADGAKIVEKDVWPKLHVHLRDVLKLMVYICACIALHHNKADTQLVRIILVK